MITELAPLATSVRETGVTACPACPHATVGHDAIATRFCAATAAGELHRGCVCTG
jgi:hypothetical protein